MYYLKTGISALILVLCSFVLLEGIRNFAAESSKNTQTVSDEITGKIVFHTQHAKCGHTTTYSDEQIYSFPTADAIHKEYPTWTATTENGIIHLTKETQDYCPNHYFARLIDETIQITSVSTGQTVTDISTQPLSLAPEEKEKLVSGIRLDSKQALTAFIEDFSS